MSELAVRRDMRADLASYIKAVHVGMLAINKLAAEWIHGL
jgi:hypothetical protein